MDMLPPQAPPAHVAHANQAALDALERMEDTQRWLTEQQEALLELVSGSTYSSVPDTEHVSLDDFGKAVLEAVAGPSDANPPDTVLTSFDAFWEVLVEQAPGKPAAPRRQALALRLAMTASDDATLRRNDGTLTDDQATRVLTLVQQAGSSLPTHIKAYELLAGTVPYAGALVLQDDRHPDQVLLFTTQAGWQVFDSLNALYRDVERGMRKALTRRAELPGVSMDDIDAIIVTHFLDIRAIGGDVFDTLARRLIGRLHEQIVFAWTLASTPEERNDALGDALNLHPLLDVHAIVRHRDLALTIKHGEERLAEQPAIVRDQWRRAANDYRDRLHEATTTAQATVPPLATFAGNALATALREHGIDLSPHDLRVRLTHRLLHKPIATAFSGFRYEELSLLELAYRNVGDLPTEGLQVIHADGSPRSDVSAETLRDIVRDLDLPHRYAQHLDNALMNSSEGQRQRDAGIAFQKARMRFEAADARLAYYSSHEPRSFRFDHRERGFQWVQAVLDHPHPANRALVEKHEIVVRQLTYQREPVAGVFLIGTRQPDAVSSVVLYTPDAPDGVAFREFSDRAELTRDFLLNRRFETYLLDRLPATFAETNALGQRRFKLVRFNDNRPASWVFNLPVCTGCTELAEHFEEREVSTSFLDTAYTTAIRLAKRNASDMTRSTAAADVGSAFDVFWYWNPFAQVVLEAVTGVVHSVPRTAQAAWRFYDHVKSGDSIEAFLAFVDGYTSSLMVLPLYTHVPSATGARMRAAPGSRTLAPTLRTVPPPEALFNKRYLAEGVTLPSKEPASGVFTIGADDFIRHRGQAYYVRFDSDIKGWRLRPPPGSSYGPSVEKVAEGQWGYRRVGLVGGGNLPGRHARSRYRGMQEAPIDIRAENELLNPDVAALTLHQRSVLTDTLNRSLSARDYTHTLDRMLGGDAAPARLSAAQARAWNEALAAARRAPPTLRPTSSIDIWAAVDTWADNSRLNPDVAALTRHQRFTFVESLAHSRLLTTTEYALTLEHMLGSDTAPTRLSPAQLVAWNRALEAGRRAPGEAPTLSPTPTPSEAPSPAQASPALPVQEEGVLGPYVRKVRWAIAAERWPDSVYAYFPGQLHGTDALSIGLQRFKVSRGGATDLWVTGIPVTTLPPTTPLASLPPELVPWLPAHANTGPGATLGSALGNGIRINLRALSENMTTARYRAFKLYGTNSSDAYVLYRTDFIGIEPSELEPTLSDPNSVRLLGNEFDIAP